MSLLRMTRGDSAAWEFPVKKPDGSVQPITGATLTFTAKARATDADVDAVIRKDTTDGVIITDGAAGLCRLRLDPSDTDSMDVPRTMVWDLQLTDGSGEVWTLDFGLLIVQPDVTRTVP